MHFPGKFFASLLITASALNSASAASITETFKRFMEQKKENRIFHCTADHVTGFRADKVGRAPEEWEAQSFHPRGVTFNIYERTKDNSTEWTIIAVYDSGSVSLFADLEPSDDETTGESGGSFFNLGGDIRGRDFRVFTAAHMPTDVWSEVRWLVHGLCRDVSGVSE